jgi:stage III sporulation protein SpoIIIAA
MTNDKLHKKSMQTTDELQKLLDILPQNIRQVLQQHPERANLIEVVLDLGRYPEARFLEKAEYLAETTVTKEYLSYCIQRVGQFGEDNRAGIEQTLHRISAIRNRAGEIIGLTCRVGRAVKGTIHMIRDLVETNKSILMLGRPGVGKTTALREIARVLADELNKRVVIIDTSNEIAGDGDIPHPAIGRARRMQVVRPELQHQVMIEAVENHMPEVIVIDEIGTELEAMAARTIAERGVMLVGTAHGNQIENLIKNPTLSDLIGGIQSVTLGDEEARRRRTQKTILERKAPPTFQIAVEMSERQRWVVHESVAETVDSLLLGLKPSLQVRTVDENGNVTITKQSPTTSLLTVAEGTLLPSYAPEQPTGWRATGKILPLPQVRFSSSHPDSAKTRLVLSETPDTLRNDVLEPPDNPHNSEQLLRVYPYGVSRHQLQQVIQMLSLPVVLIKDIESADAIVAVRSHVRKHANLRRIADEHQLPIHTLKASTIPQITRTLRACLGIEELDTSNDEYEISTFAQTGNEDDEIDALEEARLAVEQIVLPKGQPVELLPRSASVRKMQHELVERYHLTSSSFGNEPNRRLRIYPA